MPANPETINHLRRALADAVMSQNAAQVKALNGYMRLLGALEDADPRKDELRGLIRESFKSLESALSEIP